MLLLIWDSCGWEEEEEEEEEEGFAMAEAEVGLFVAAAAARGPATELILFKISFR